MALEHVVDSLDNVPEGLQGEYIAGQGDLDGKYILDVKLGEGLEIANVQNLKKSIQAERKNVSTLNKKLSSFSGIENPQEAIDAMSKLAELGDMDTSQIAEQTKKQLQKRYDDMSNQLTKKHKLEIDELSNKNNTLQKQLENSLISSSVASAINAEKGNIDLLKPIVTNMVSLIEEDGRQVARVLDGDGSIKLSVNPGSTEPMSIAELVGTLKTDTRYSAAFYGAGASGSGMAGSSGGDSAGSVITIDSAKARNNPRLYQDAKAKAAKTGQRVEFN